MKSWNMKTATVGFALGLVLAGNAAAECKLSSPGRNGTVQDNHLVAFTAVTGETLYTKTYQDKAWVGIASTVEPVNGCDAIVYTAKSGHTRVKSGAKGSVAADAKGVGCQCVKKK